MATREVGAAWRPLGGPIAVTVSGTAAGACVASIAAWRPVDVGEVSAVTEVAKVNAGVATWVVAASAVPTCPSVPG